MANVALGHTRESEAAFQAWRRYESRGRDDVQAEAEVERVAALGAHLKAQHAAAAHLERAFQLQEEAGSSRAERAHTLGMLARCRINLKDYEQAENCMLRALLLLEASPDATETMLAGGFLRTLLGEVLFAQMRFR